jgi:hypothetical protein
MNDGVEAGTKALLEAVGNNASENVRLCDVPETNKVFKM